MRELSKTWWFWLVTLVASGCSDAASHPGPSGPLLIREGDPALFHGEEFHVTVSSPPEGHEFEANEKIPISVEVEIPSGRGIPDHVMICIMDGKARQFASTLLKNPSESPGNRHVFRGSLTAPEKKGRYFLQAYATDSVRRMSVSEGGRGPQAHPAISVRNTPSAKVEVRIK